VSRTLITDDTLPHLSKLASLQRLALNNTHISDQGLIALTPLVHLSILSVRDTLVTAEGARLLEKVSRSEDLWVFEEGDYEAADDNGF
jgi:hypothetical protein